MVSRANVAKDINVVPLRTKEQGLSLTELSDLLIQVGETRDRDAFVTLFTHFGPRLKAFLLRTERDEDRVESIVQDVMVTVWRKAKYFDATKSNASTWLFTMARNRLIDQVRHEGRQRKLKDSFALNALAEEAEVEHPLQQFDTQRQVASLLEELPEDQARTVILAFIEGRSHREIAELTGVPTGTVKSRLRLAFKRMRAKLEEQN